MRPPDPDVGDARLEPVPLPVFMPAVPRAGGAGPPGRRTLSPRVGMPPELVVALRARPLPSPRSRTGDGGLDAEAEPEPIARIRSRASGDTVIVVLAR